MEKALLRTKQLVCLFLMLTSMLIGLSFLPRARAAMVIASITPTAGNVGTNVTVTANLTTANGGYNVTFDDRLEAAGTAVNNSVKASFIVPESIAGNHTVRVIDVKTLDNASTFFLVTTEYFLNVTLPAKQLQEGESVPVSLSLTGGNSSSSYAINFSVQTPTNLNFTGESIISTSSDGSGNATLTYPGGFSTGANTSYVGNYIVSANVTANTVSFFVGLTNSTVYHRNQVVDIKALYAPNENVTVTISGSDVQNSANVTADSMGTVDYSNWTVPITASIGSYNVNISSISGPTVKAVPDTQNFTVPGFPFNVTARNLAGDAVPNVEVRAFENATSVSNQTTGSDGTAVLMLELTIVYNYTLQGYYQNQNVGEDNFSVTGTEAVDFLVSLSDMKIQVDGIVSGVEKGIPGAGLYLMTGTGNFNLTTDVTGGVIAYSLLPDANYTLSASRYGSQFNVTDIPTLLVSGNPVAFFNVTIICPSFTLRVNAFKANGQPFGNAVVQAKEMVGGINYEETADTQGLAVFQNATMGVYSVEIYDSTGLELNGTVVNLFEDQNVTVYCNFFGLNISITVTDFFGQPFSNINVALQGNGSASVSEKTQANGVATFANLVGNSFSVSVYLSNQASPTVVESLQVNNSTNIPIRLDKYVLLAGFPVETSQLALAIIIVLSLFLVVSMEVYRRRRKRHTIDS